MEMKKHHLKPIDPGAPPAPASLRGTSHPLLSKTPTSLRCFSGRVADPGPASPSGLRRGLREGLTVSRRSSKSEDG